MATPLTDIWATDEDVYNRAQFDFHTLIPPPGILAEGTDGQIDQASPWRLSSTTWNFAAMGVAAGHIVRLDKPLTYFKAPGSFYVVDSVSAQGIALRLPTQVAGVGRPPTGGVTASGLSYSVLTLKAQIEQASYHLNRTFGVDANVRGRTPTDLFDRRQLEEATSYRVLAMQYQAAAKQPGDIFSQKAEMFLGLSRDAESAINLVWKGSANQPPTTTNKFSMRMER